MPNAHKTLEPARSASSGATGVDPIVNALDRLDQVLAAMDDAQYTRNPVGVFRCSVGGQVRHVLDHVVLLLDGIREGRFDYDRRERGTDIEHDRSAARGLVAEMIAGLRELPAEHLDGSARLSVILRDDGRAADVETSVGRELAFVLSHTIHHQAMIGAMAATLGVEVPRYFGYAPATIAHLEQGSRCAR